MRAALIALALLVGFAGTDAFAKDAVLVKLRGDTPAKRAAKPTPAKKSTTRAKHKPVHRAKHVTKAKAKAKPKTTAEQPRLRPMP